MTMKHIFIFTFIFTIALLVHSMAPLRAVSAGHGGGGHAGRGGRATRSISQTRPSFTRPASGISSRRSISPIPTGVQRAQRFQAPRVRPQARPLTPQRQIMRPIVGQVTSTPATSGIIRGTIGQAAPAARVRQPQVSAPSRRPSFRTPTRGTRGPRDTTTSKRDRHRFDRRRRRHHRPRWWYPGYSYAFYPYYPYPDYDTYSPFTDATNIVNPEVLGINPNEYPYYTDRPSPAAYYTPYTSGPIPEVIPVPQEPLEAYPPIEAYPPLMEGPPEGPEVSTTIIDVQPQQPQPIEEVPETTDAQDILEALIEEELTDVHHLS
jgi:hypothetical protein